jgi:hypothetical protein
MHKIIGALPPKWKLSAILALSFAGMFTVFVFTPLDLYLQNPTSFMVSWKFFMPALIATAAIGTAALTAMFILLWHKKTWLGVTILILCAAPFAYFRYVRLTFERMSIYVFAAAAVGIVVWILLTKALKHRALDLVLLVIWGAFAAAYIQVLFLNGDMTLITGDRASYNELTLGNTFNIVIWVLITLLPLFIWALMIKKNKEFKFEKPLAASVLIICAMQLAGLVSTAVSTELPVGYEDNPQYLSYAPTMRYSTGNNVCVFLLDRFDVQYMTEVLENFPELYEQLDGFTFYENNVAEFGGTFPSVPKMLTEHYYTDDLTFSEYWKEAWSRHTPIDTLRENGFTTNLLIDKLSTYGNFDEIQNRTDNIELGKAVLRYKGMFDRVCRLTLGRLSPYFMKNFFLAPLGSDFGNQFFLMDFSLGQRLAVGAATDRAFYNYIIPTSILADSDKPVFNFIHMNCAHVDFDKSIVAGGYHYDALNDTIVDEGNYIDTTRGCFEILGTYFRKLKEAGVYDNTTIILLGDHGRGLNKDADAPVTTGLLIKPQGVRGALETDTSTELSNKYFGASILEAAGLPHEDYGLSYFDIIGGAPAPARQYYQYDSWWNARGSSESIKLSGTYEISGDASKWENWSWHKAGD